MSRAEALILVELNELCPDLISRYIDEGVLPNFKRLRERSAQFITESDEKGDPTLEPWIQWYSLHCGIPYSQHGVFRIGDGAKRLDRSLWDRLADAGMRVMNFSSMNCRETSGPGHVFVPDPWNKGAQAHPAALSPVQQFLAKAVQEQGNARWSAGELARVAYALFSNGLRFSTIAASVRQLLRERDRSVDSSWRRVEILDRIQFDVFRHWYLKSRPNFATFFSNSTAHLQHACWRFHEPEKFSGKISERDLRSYGNAVKSGYMFHDRILGEVLDMASRTGARVALATALSQQPYTAYEGRGGRYYYRPIKVDALMRQMGIRFEEVQPIMAHQFIVSFGTEADMTAALQSLQSPMYKERAVFDAVPMPGENKIAFGCQIYGAVDDNDKIRLANGEEVPFFRDLYRLEFNKSGSHHPDGVFWLETPDKSPKAAGRVSLLDVAPTLLAAFQVGAADLPGRVVVPSGA